MRRYGRRCAVRMTRVSPTRVSRWGTSSRRARRGGGCGLRSSGGGRAVVLLSRRLRAECRRKLSRPRVRVWLNPLVRGSQRTCRRVGVMLRWGLCEGHMMWSGWRVRALWTTWCIRLRSGFVSSVVRRRCGFAGSWRPGWVRRGRGSLFAPERGRIHRPVARIHRWELRIRWRLLM